MFNLGIVNNNTKSKYFNTKFRRLLYYKKKNKVK